MKNIFFAPIICAIILCCASSLPAIEVNFSPSLSPCGEDMYQTQCPPEIDIITLDKVFQGQMIFPYIEIKEPLLSEDGQGKIQIQLKLRNKLDAKEAILESTAEITFTGNHAFYRLNPFALVATQYEIGSYELIAVVTDQNAMDTITQTVAFDLDKFVPNLQPWTLNKNTTEPLIMVNYFYLLPSPEDIIGLYLGFLQLEPKYAEKNERNLNALSFFYEVFKNNRFMLPTLEYILSESTNLSARKNSALLLHLLSAEDQKNIIYDNAEITDFVSAWPHDVFEVKKAIHPIQINFLFNEFLVTGSLDSIKKIVEVIDSNQDTLSSQEYEKIAQPTEEQQNSNLRFLTAQRAKDMLSEYISIHPLLLHYCVELKEENKYSPATNDYLNEIIYSCTPLR